LQKEQAGLIVDLHIHSIYSQDSNADPAAILKVASEKRLNGVAVTDHHTIRGGLETLRANKDPNFLVIVGSEIETDKGDIIGLFLTEEIQSRKAREVIKEIKEQGGIVLWAHPYRTGKDFLPNDLIKNVDLIEGFNAKTQESQNMLAQELASRIHKPVVGTSDAHSSSEIGNGATLVDCADIKAIQESLAKGRTRIIGIKLSYEHLYDVQMPVQQWIRQLGSYG
jgi:predicted metal-dependent phosphoesterase TrpH